VAELAAVVRFLDDELRTAEVPDYDSALNGLQLANGGQVTRIAAAVDYSTATIAGAIRERADLLVVHHGMFWSGSERIVGPAYARLSAALAGGLAIYSSHLPLDLHPKVGNNPLLARALELESDGTFGRYKDVEIGVQGPANLTTAALFERVRAYSARYATHAVCTPCPAERRTKRWAIITGSGASPDSLEEAVERGIDTLIVGEGPHHSAVAASELGVVVMYAGHYATETLGVQAAAELVARQFSLQHLFVNVPTGL
jgi:dinuclear metal center YbgI/SA1388 family protein